MPFTVNAEIHPPESKALGSTLAFSFNWLCTFVVTKFRPEMESWFGTSGTYFFYGTICVVGAVFVIIFLPETKGKGPEEIRNLFGEGDKHTQEQIKIEKERHS